MAQELTEAQALVHYTQSRRAWYLVFTLLPPGQVTCCNTLYVKMGKIRRGRQKLHLRAVKPDDQKDEECNLDNLKLNESILPAIFPVKGLFGTCGSSENKAEKNTKIDSTRSKEKPACTSKADKRKQRHERFLNKLNASRAVEDRAKNAKERAKTVVVGDMHPLLSALPTVKLPAVKDEDTTCKRERNSLNTRRSRSKKTRKNRQLADIEQFQQVLSHPAYKANPLAAISVHLKNAIHMEQESNT